MRHFFLVLLLLTELTVHAQKDTVYLVSIEKSADCLKPYPNPWFSSNQTISDTSYIRLLGRNDCNGYHDPSVTLSGDTVLISIPCGIVKTVYSIHGQYFNEEQMNATGLKPYKDSLAFKEVYQKGECTCAFAFDLKISGLNPEVNYQYCYNGEPVDLTYHGAPPRIEFEFPYFIKVSKHKVYRKIKRIIMEEKVLNELEDASFSVTLIVDTISGLITETRSYFAGIKRTESARKKAENYFQTLPPVRLVNNPNKGNRRIEQYRITFILSEKKKIKMIVESGEYLYVY
jgi:hypothetical protein